MEYAFLAGACICFSFQFIFSKLFQRRTDGTLHASMWSNLLSGISLFAVFFCINVCINGLKPGFNPVSFGLASVYALSSIVCTCASLAGMSVTTVAAITLYTLLGGVVLPFFYGIIMLSERPSAFRFTGVFLLVAATVIPYIVNSFSEKKDAGDSRSNSKQKIKAAVCCAVVFLTNGLISIVTTAATRVNDALSEYDFLLQGTAVRIAVSVIIIIVLTLRSRSKNPLPKDAGEGKEVSAKIFFLLTVFSFFYAMLNGAGNIFSLNCAKTMDASLQYPVISASCIVISAVTGLVLFKERPAKGDIAGICLSVVGIVFTIF